jgi:protein-disulfide isomerase
VNKRWLCAAAALVTTAGILSCGGDDDDGGNAAANASPSAAGVVGTASPSSEFGKLINETHVPEDLADGKRIGKPDAKVTIEAFEDFGCPHCLEFTAKIEPVLMKEYVATGKVAFEYKYFPLRQQTAVAAIAAQCAAEQDKFWPYHRALFTAQAEANAKSGPSLTEAFAPPNLRTIGTNIGVDPALFDACLSAESAAGVVQAELRKANELALPGTPSFVINGEVTDGPATIQGWRDLLNGLLK